MYIHIFDILHMHVNRVSLCWCLESHHLMGWTDSMTLPFSPENISKHTENCHHHNNWNNYSWNRNCALLIGRGNKWFIFDWCNGSWRQIPQSRMCHKRRICQRRGIWFLRCIVYKWTCGRWRFFQWLSCEKERL